MSIIGIDLGCYSTYIAGIKDGSVEILANEYSLLATPTVVAFNSVPRPMGVSARQQLVPKFQSTAAFFKTLFRRDVDQASDVIDAIPCEKKPATLKNNELYASMTVKNKNGQPVVYTVQQVLAAYLTKLFDLSRQATGTPVEECLLTVPYYLTVADRQVILEAAKIAGFPFIRLINETAALAASYAFFKKSVLPAAPEPPRRVVFVDIGYSQAQVSLAEVHRDGAKVLLATHSDKVGGYFIDDAIRRYFAEVFMETKKMDASTNRKAWIKLAEEAEKAKKSLSAMSNTTIAQIECLMNDVDFKAPIDRAKLEELCAPVFGVFEQLLVNFVAESKLNPTEVEVEIVGGSSRIPALRAIVERVFQQSAKTTMNQDEAVVRGTALMAGLLSPRVRSTTFKLEDFIARDIIARYVTDNGEQRDVTIFKRGDIIPNKKSVTLHRPDVQLFHGGYNTCPRQELLHISNIGVSGKNDPDPNAKGAPKYRISLFYDIDHILSVRGIIRSQVVLVEKEPEPAPKPEEKTEKDGGEQQPAADGAAPPPTDPAPPQAPAAPEQPAAPKELVEQIRDTRLEPFRTLSNGVRMADQSFIDAENAMRAADFEATKKGEAKNALEAFLYEIREKIDVSSSLFIPEKKEGLSSFLNQIEEFLYEDDDMFSIQDFVSKHEMLVKAYNESIVQPVTVQEVAADTPSAMEVDPKVEEPPSN